MRANESKSYRLIFASHSSTTSPSCFRKGKIGPYEGKSVGDKNQSLTISTPAVAMAQWENRGLLLPHRNQWVVIVFFPKSQFRRCSLNLTKRSESTSSPFLN